MVKATAAKEGAKVMKAMQETKVLSPPNAKAQVALLFGLEGKFDLTQGSPGDSKSKHLRHRCFLRTAPLSSSGSFETRYNENKRTI